MKNLKLPANYEMISAEESVEVYGGGMASQICYAFGRMFRSYCWEKEAEKLSETSHLFEYSVSVVPRKGNVYPFGCSGLDFRSKVGYIIGNFFYGLGDLFKVLGL